MFNIWAEGQGYVDFDDQKDAIVFYHMCTSDEKDYSESNDCYLIEI